MVDVGRPLPGRTFVGNPFDLCRRELHERFSTEPGSTQLEDREGSGPRPPPGRCFHYTPFPIPPKTGLPFPEAQLEQGPRGQERG